MSTRGRDTTPELAEVRSVLTRAETARDRLDDLTGEADPDAREMRIALDEVVELLDPWRRTGAPKRNQPAADCDRAGDQSSGKFCCCCGTPGCHCDL